MGWLLDFYEVLGIVSSGRFSVKNRKLENIRQRREPLAWPGDDVTVGTHPGRSGCPAAAGGDHRSDPAAGLYAGFAAAPGGLFVAKGVFGGLEPG